MRGSPFQRRLTLELAARQQRNRRFSLRALAALLGTDHSTLSQVLRGKRRVPAGRLHGWAARLGLDPEEIAVYIAAEGVPDAGAAAWQEQVRHWTGEALAVAAEPVHRQILELSRSPQFCADCRWIAAQTGVALDEVNLALTRLLRLGLLRMSSAGEWQDLTGLPQVTAPAFRTLALARVRAPA
jgi:transcriptional regulator with XRE-family HTH domain